MTGRGNGNAKVQQLFASIGINLAMVATLMAMVVYLFINYKVGLFLILVLVALGASLAHVKTSVLVVKKNHIGLVFHNDMQITTSNADVITQGTWWYLDLLFGRKEVLQVPKALQTIDGTKNFQTDSNTEAKVRYQIEWSFKASELIATFKKVMDGVVDLKKVENLLKERFEAAATRFFLSKKIEQVVKTSSGKDLKDFGSIIEADAKLMISHIGINVDRFILVEVDYADENIAKAAAAKQKATFDRVAATVAGRAVMEKMASIYGDDWKNMTPDQKTASIIANSPGDVALTALIKKLAAK